MTVTDVRALYKYNCTNCGEPRGTLIEERGEVGVCMACKKLLNISEDQTSIFDVAKDDE
ncbi:MAG: hypothetical protein KAT71_08155 [Gammaproteobacteria bacterium]|nr:hypothetical protein [Gammaproteobacteria bacterium]